MPYDWQDIPEVDRGGFLPPAAGAGDGGLLRHQRGQGQLHTEPDGATGGQGADAGAELWRGGNSRRRARAAHGAGGGRRLARGLGGRKLSAPGGVGPWGRRGAGGFRVGRGIGKVLVISEGTPA